MATGAGHTGMDNSPGKGVVHTDPSVAAELLPPEYFSRVFSCVKQGLITNLRCSHPQFMQQSSSFKYKQSCINKKEKKKKKKGFGD